MKDFDYEKRWVTLGHLIENQFYDHQTNPIQFRKTVLRDILRMMEAINLAEKKCFVARQEFTNEKDG
jgi:hypothetical protein